MALRVLTRALSSLSLTPRIAVAPGLNLLPAVQVIYLTGSEAVSIWQPEMGHQETRGGGVRVWLGVTPARDLG